MYECLERNRKEERSMNRNRIALFALLFLIVFNILVPTLHAQPLSEMSEEERNQKIKQEIERVKKEREKYKHPKVAEILVELEEAYKNGAEEAAKRFQAGETLKDKEGKNITSLEDAEKEGAEEAAEKFAKENDLRIKKGNKIRLTLILKIGFTAETIDNAVLHPYGGEIGKGSGNRLQAEIPIYQIRKIADEVEWIEWIELPSYGVPLSYSSEGVGLTGTSSYHAANIDGAGIKVAIIDLGFAGLSSAISSGDIPSNVIKGGIGVSP